MNQTIMVYKFTKKTSSKPLNTELQIMWYVQEKLLLVHNKLQKCTCLELTLTVC